MSLPPLLSSPGLPGWTRWVNSAATARTEDVVMESPPGESGRGSVSTGMAEGPCGLRARCFLAETVISAVSPALCVSPLSNALVGVCRSCGLGRSPSVTSWRPPAGQNRLRSIPAKCEWVLARAHGGAQAATWAVGVGCSASGLEPAVEVLDGADSLPL